MRHEWKSHVDPDASANLFVEIRQDGLWKSNASEIELVRELHALAERVRELEGITIAVVEERNGHMVPVPVAIRERDARIAALDEENRRLKERLALLLAIETFEEKPRALFGGGTRCPDGELHYFSNGKCIRCDALPSE